MFEFDQEFVQMMRDELDNQQLDIVWKPDVMRLHATNADVKQRWFGKGDRGCWVVVMTVRQCVPVLLDDGARVVCSQEVPYDVMVLNGNHGNPMTPGRWVIDALAASDRARHGRAREKQMDEWRESKVVAEQASRDQFAYDHARDPILMRTMKAAAEAAGMATPDRGEMIELEKQAIASSQWLADRDLADRKASRLRA